eukprot:2140985-Amphidinium_carterae.1
MRASKTKKIAIVPFILLVMDICAFNTMATLTAADEDVVSGSQSDVKYSYASATNSEIRQMGNNLRISSLNAGVASRSCGKVRMNDDSVCFGMVSCTNKIPEDAGDIAGNLNTFAVGEDRHGAGLGPKYNLFDDDDGLYNHSFSIPPIVLIMLVKLWMLDTKFEDAVLLCAHAVYPGDMVTPLLIVLFEPFKELYELEPTSGNQPFIDRFDKILTDEMVFDLVQNK